MRTECVFGAGGISGSQHVALHEGGAVRVAAHAGGDRGVKTEKSGEWHGANFFFRPAVFPGDGVKYGQCPAKAVGLRRQPF